MARILAIDYGAKRVGLAVTDPLQIIASPLETIHSKDLVSFLKSYTEKEEVAAFVVGMPKKLDNTDTNATQMAKGCVTILRKNFPHISIHLQDERFTSQMAMSAMISGGVKKKDRQNKANIDKVSAAIILQSYLERSSRL
ncbi:Holliday junction resolvase RuvX [Nafulsella turpanensis]|uniref:Holliday junction resolvase RuvX n=1 Tax=Nafulsella turpanensis TaxID=1265690 RepID=UPI0003477E48|nr:Holliday junction resolvase RuvX [Nafulsella turpanensis]